MRSILLRLKLVVFLLSFAVSSAVMAQVQTARNIAIVPNSPGFYEYLPQGYNPSGSETYPVLLFIHGMGELGNGGADLARVLQNGPPRLIRDGKFPVSFSVGGKTHKFIVISPQFKGWPSRGDINEIINYILRTYKANENRVYMTGLSMGGGITWEYAGGISPVYAYRLAGIVPVCGASWPERTRARTIATNNVPVWATHNNGDGTVPVWYTDNYVQYINEAPAPQYPAKKSIFTSTSHDAWSKTYDPAFKENNLNVYEWLLQFERGANLPPVPNQIPVVNIGVDRIINLPVNSIQISGTASDPDGTIASLNWTRISGPTQFSFSNTNIANPTIGNLAEGNYTFRLTATDNKGGTGFDDINVIVNAAAPPGSQRVLIDIGPTATASPDQWGNHWNNMSDGRVGVRVFNAKTTTNISSGLSLEVVNQLNGSWDVSGTSLSAGNTVGIVGDYPASSTADYAIAHSSTTSGKWKLTGLEANKSYKVKIWGTRNNASDNRTIQIKRSTETVWKEYNALNNTNYSQSALFENITGLTEVIFDIRVKSGQQFGNICLMDILVSGAGNPEPVNQAPAAQAGNDQNITLPVNSVQLSGSGTDSDGTIASYSWSKISGPAQFSLSSGTIANPVFSNLVAGTYVLRLTVTDNKGATGTDDVSVVVSNGVDPDPDPVVYQRVLIDIGPAATASPDAGGNYWNTMTDGRPGIRVNNARTTTNTPSGINLEVINKTNGSWDVAGTGLGTGNSAGIVTDYPANSTTDFAIVHSSTTSGQWKISGMDAAKTYRIKFWGTRTSTGTRIIQIKRSSESTWKEYDAVNNKDFNKAAIFENISGVTEVIFDIKVKAGQTFGHISVVDISTGTDAAVNSNSTGLAILEAKSLEDAGSANIVIYPSPVKESFVLQLNNPYQGLMKVQILNLSGIAQKEFILKKDGVSSSNTLSANGLSSGMYFIKVQIGEWIGYKKIMKL